MPAVWTGHGCKKLAFCSFIASFLQIGYTFTVAWVKSKARCLDLVLLETVLPEGSEGGDTVLAEVNQDVPIENSG